MPRPTWAEIDLDAIAHNVRAIRAKIGRRVKMLAAVKADAYGHGAVPVSCTALEHGADMLGVATVEEAVELRENEVAAPILILGCVLPEEAEAVVEHGLAATVCDLAVAEALSRSAVAQAKRVSVHVKVDTGMGRIGVRPDEALEFVRRIVRLHGLSLDGLFTHFPSADETDKTFTRQQIAAFSQVIQELEADGIRIPLKHAANSAAILDLPESYFDMVRPGLILYGLHPSPDVQRSMALKPAMTLKTRVVFLKDVPAGTPLSYSRTFTTRRPSRIATLPIGYADGLSRGLSNKGAALIRGQRAAVVGRICMDQCLADVTDIPGAAVGDEVVVYGTQGGERISIEEVAQVVGTIPYEITCAVSRRVPRKPVSE